MEALFGVYGVNFGQKRGKSGQSQNHVHFIEAPEALQQEILDGARNGR